MSDTPRTDALVADGWSDGPWAEKHRQLERENAALRRIVVRVAEQQAYPDDWWKAEIAALDLRKLA